MNQSEPIGLLLALASVHTVGCTSPMPAPASDVAPTVDGGRLDDGGTDVGRIDGGELDVGAPADTGSVTLVTATFDETTEDFPNPERGFYGWSGADFITRYEPASVRSAYDQGWRLVLAKVQLDSYRTTDLPASLLADLGARLADIRSAGMKVTLLFNYDFSFSGNDATAAQIRRHLEQLAPVLADNDDVIPFMRAGFIGAWGEWHHSASGSSCGILGGSASCDVANANRLVVRDALLEHVPATTEIGFRYPADLMRWYPSPTEQDRAGVHNDCFLAGPTDTGTYTGAGSREYTRALSEATAFGGENCVEGPLRTACADILREGAEYHVAWLNGSDWSGFMTAWRSGGCYDDVSRQLGYRLVLDEVSHATVTSRGGRLLVRVALRNVGWARAFTERPLVVTLVHSAGATEIEGRGGRLRDLPPQATTAAIIEIEVPIPADAPPGDYDVHLSAPDVFPRLADDPRFGIRFANTDEPARSQSWDGARARYRVGTSVEVLP